MSTKLPVVMIAFGGQVTEANADVVRKVLPEALKGTVLENARVVVLLNVTHLSVAIDKPEEAPHV